MKRAVVMWAHPLGACPRCMTNAALVAQQGDIVGKARAEAMDAAVGGPDCLRKRVKCKPRQSHYFVHAGQPVEPADMEPQEQGAGRPAGIVVRDRAIQIRVSGEEWDTLYTLAEAHGSSVATQCRDIILLFTNAYRREY